MACTYGEGTQVGFHMSDTNMSQSFILERTDKNEVEAKKTKNDESKIRAEYIIHACMLS